MIYATCLRRLLVCLSVLAGLGASAAVTGQVVLDGPPPAEMEITPVVHDPYCKAAYSGGPVPTTRHHVVGADGGLANVLVYVEGGERLNRGAAAPQDPVLIDQVRCFFQPYVLGVQTGQVVRIRNGDPHLHNVQLEESKAGNRPFNFTQTSAGLVTEKTFDHPEVFLKLKCAIHPWMFAYVAVLAHPFHAVTDGEGNFSIPGLPDGRHTLVFQHLKAGKLTNEVEVLGGTARHPIRVALKPGPGTPGPAIRPATVFDSSPFPGRVVPRPIPGQGSRPASAPPDQDRDREAAQRKMEYELRQLENRTAAQILRLQLEGLAGGPAGSRSSADEIQRLRSGAAAEAEAIRQKYQGR